MTHREISRFDLPFEKCNHKLKSATGNATCSVLPPGACKQTTLVIVEFVLILEFGKRAVLCQI